MNEILADIRDYSLIGYRILKTDFDDAVAFGRFKAGGFSIEDDLAHGVASIFNYLISK